MPRADAGRLLRAAWRVDDYASVANKLPLSAVRPMWRRRRVGRSGARIEVEAEVLGDVVDLATGEPRLACSGNVKK